MIDYKDCEDEDDGYEPSEREYYPEDESDDVCPNCGNEYDEIDYEYQICHYCKYENK